MNYKTLSQRHFKNPTNGFTMIEVLIAGIVLFAVMAGVSRISVAALTGSAHSSERAKIEAAINDNIQAIQKEDSYYKEAYIKENKGETSFTDACSKPTENLSQHLTKTVPEPRVEEIERVFSFKDPPQESDNNEQQDGGVSDAEDPASTIPSGILRITYTFEGPEQSIQEEKRIIELNPNFAASCYTTQPNIDNNDDEAQSTT